jgi:hypothetical protein
MQISIFRINDFTGVGVKSDDDINSFIFFSQLLDTLEDLLVTLVHAIKAANRDDRITELRQC